uniref:RAB6A-GEF complex partner protein 2-like n=1 Tax=Hirondellea gigas TaxID=1518452 RepID=A0A6A7G7A3_9CRUS
MRMVVEVAGHVEGGSVVAAGDAVNVCITVTAPAATKDHNGGAIEDSAGELVSWCSAQIHCICTTNESYVVPPEPQKPETAKTGLQGNLGTPGTSFAPWRGETGQLVLTTKPTIIFCELVLQPGQSRTFRYREIVPSSGPPSYRGQHVKYSWKVTVGAQRHGSKIALIRLPLRVMLLPQPMPGVLESAYSESEEELSPSNPFLHQSSRHQLPTIPPSALLQVWPSRSVRAYNVVHSRGHVVKFSIFRSSYKLGDDILATLDFTQWQIPCVQYSVCLQSVEEISSEHKKRSKQGPSVVSYSKTHELCLSMSHTSLLLPVPLHVTPAFEVDMVSLQYRLHFEFVLCLNDSNKKLAKAKKKNSKKVNNSTTTSSESSGNKASSSTKGGTEARDSSTSSVDSVNNSVGDTGSDDDGGWQTLEDGSQFWSAPHQLDIETLVWDLPINICPSPLGHLTSALNLPESFAQMAV